jgi:hypothetical protein
MGGKLTRVLLTIAAIPVGGYLGMFLAIPVVGAPHSMPGLLMHASEPVRYWAGLGTAVATPVFLIWLIWREPLRRAMSKRRGETTEPWVRPTSPPNPTELVGVYRQKTSEELLAMLATEGRALYPPATYALVRHVLDERSTAGGNG